MRRDRLLIDEMIDASQRIVDLVGDLSAEDIAMNRERRDAILWNFTVLGEAATFDQRAGTRTSAGHRLARSSAAAQPHYPRVLVDRPRCRRRCRSPRCAGAAPGPPNRGGSACGDGRVNRPTTHRVTKVAALTSTGRCGAPTSACGVAVKGVRVRRIGCPVRPTCR